MESASSGKEPRFRNRDCLETAELDLFAVVPPDPELPVSQPGILFCLRQRDNKRPTEVNPLAPYYLVYVLDDGNARLTFMQPKQALELFRALASNHTSAFTDLCDAIDGRNANGTDMTHESALLDSAVESIKRTFARRATSSLLSGHDHEPGDEFQVIGRGGGFGSHLSTS